jgi:hypothetical protein
MFYLIFHQYPPPAFEERRELFAANHLALVDSINNKPAVGQCYKDTQPRRGVTIITPGKNPGKHISPK